MVTQCEFFWVPQAFLMFDISWCSQKCQTHQECWTFEIGLVVLVPPYGGCVCLLKWNTWFACRHDQWVLLIRELLKQQTQHRAQSQIKSGCFSRVGLHQLKLSLNNFLSRTQLVAIDLLQDVSTLRSLSTAHRMTVDEVLRVKTSSSCVLLKKLLPMISATMSPYSIIETIVA